MTRAEHLQWCKDRAIEYIQGGDISQGITSMMSDMRKHQETTSESCMTLCMMMLKSGQLTTQQEAEKFINGFN